MSPDAQSPLNSLPLDLPVAIVGMGLSGKAALRLLLTAGIPREQIFTFDQKAEAEFHNPEELFKKVSPKTLCISPGVPLSTPWIQSALKRGVRLTSELELAFCFLSNEKIISITGSVGKSTTTAMIGSACDSVFVGGNFGNPLADYLSDILEKKISRVQFIVLELSSYQLENFKNFRTDVAVLTSLNANHLERYPTMADYYETKLKIFSRTSGLKIANKSGGDIHFVKDKTVQFVDRHLFPGVKAAVIGSHNYDNLAMALTVAKYFGQSSEKILAFKGLSHRMENCGEHSGILFVNDSKATTMDSVLQAALSIRESYPERRIHLLLGGRDKNLPWHRLADMKDDGNMAFWFFGEFGPTARTQSGLSGEVSANLSLCLKNLKPFLKGTDAVLLSPGGTSLDEFKNFEERGEHFKKWVSTEF
jgi:UDP-N-acetylmuramoylalanine--D-glutamate ligase